MHRSFTMRSAYQNKVSALLAKVFLLLLLVFFQAVTLFAHTVDYFSSCGYVCAGSTVTINAHVSATNSGTNYNWQFRDNSNSWKCFVNGNNTINGVVFSVSGATAKGQLSAAPTLTIVNAKTALENVDVRLVMADGNNVSPCVSSSSYTIYGTDKSLKLHVLSGNDCSKIAALCGGTTSCSLKLGNLIWNDINGNGVKDANEPGVAGATVKLYTDDNNDNNATGSVIATTTTNASGIYSFGNLKTGNYIVSVIIPAGYTKGPASTIDPDNNVDNDNNGVYLIGANQAGSEVRSKSITLTASGEPTTDGDDKNSNLTLDIPLCGNSQLGDFVWNDKNANGIQDSGEPGIQGVTVKLTFPDGVSTATDVTDANGKYLFTALAPGTYKVTFSTPSGFTASSVNQGGDDAKDSDPVSGNVTVAVAAGTSNLTIDAGFYIKAVVSNLTLGNQVWNDYDGDGKRDDNEPGIPGATISLYTDNNGDNMPDGAAIKTTMSDDQGHYMFTNLTEGKYIVSMPILPGYQQSPNNNTQDTSPFPDNNADNDDNLVRLVGPNGPGGIVYTNAITLNAGQEPVTDGDGANGNNTLDLAECGNSFIGDFVWNDLNGNGIQDAGEPGINDVLVTITFTDGRTATALTHKYEAANNPNDPIFDGYYNFPNLGPGTYKITFTTPAGLHASPANQGGNDAKDSDPVNNGPVTVTIAANQSDFTIDAGFTAYIAPPPPPTCPNLSVGNMVFLDANANGVKDVAEQGIGGLTVKLYADNDGNNVADGAAISTIITAADGTYYFGNLAAGKYLVAVTLPDSLSMGDKSNANPDDNKDNDNNGVKVVNGQVLSNFITLSAGDEPINDGSDNNSNLTLDFGFKLKAAPCTNHCECHNDCNHTGCGHANCGHNNCHNDCNHTGCGHANCGHSTSDNDCAGTTNSAGYFGGFEAGWYNFGNSAGKTDLRYGLPRNGSFEIVKKTSDAGGDGYLSLTPHGGSNFMLIHTSSDATDKLWSTTVKVVPGKTYSFSMWVANAKTDPVNGFALTLNAGSKVIATATADFNWGKLSATYTVPEGVTSIEFSIKDPYPEFSASHFLALDDICISTTESSAFSQSTASSKTVSPVYPNPAGTNFTVNVAASKQGTALISLVDMKGKTIFTESRSVTSGTNAISIDRINNITGGTYNVQVIVDNQVHNQLLIISR